MGANVLAVVLMMFAARGNISIEQIRSADRKGTGAQLQVFGGGSTTNGNGAVFDANGNVIDSGIVPGAGTTTNQNIRTVSFYFDGGGSAITATTSCTHVNYAGTIQSFTMIGQASGNATVDVQTVAYSSWTGPASASSITDSHTPAMTAATKYQDTTLMSWTTSFTAGTVVCFVMTGPTVMTWLSGNIKIAAN